MPTKRSMHHTLNAAYATLNPQAEHGKHYRAILEKAVELLELPALDKLPSARMQNAGEAKPASQPPAALLKP